MPTRSLKDINFIRGSTAPGGFGKLDLSIPNATIPFEDAGNADIDATSALTMNSAAGEMSVSKLNVGTIRTTVTFVIGDYSTAAGDSLLIVNTLGVAGTAREITISTVSNLTGRQISIKDGTGKCSKSQPIRITAENGNAIDELEGNQLFLTSPYASVSLRSDAVDGALWTVPLQNTTAFSPPILFSQDQPPTSTANVLVTLPLGATSDNFIRILMNTLTGIPFIQVGGSGAPSATMDFSHVMDNGTETWTVTPNTDTVTVVDGASYYFTPDGLAVTDQSYLASRSFGTLNINVEGDAAGSTPRTQIEIKFNSRGSPDININGESRSAEDIVLD